MFHWLLSEMNGSTVGLGNAVEAQRILIGSVRGPDRGEYA